MSLLEKVTLRLSIIAMVIILISTAKYEGNLAVLIIQLILLSVLVAIPFIYYESDKLYINANELANEDDKKKRINNINISSRRYAVLLYIIGTIYTITMFILIKTKVILLPIIVAFLPAIIIIIWVILALLIVFLCYVIDNINDVLNNKK